MEAALIYIMLTVPMVWGYGNSTTGNITDSDLPSSDVGLPVENPRTVKSQNERLQKAGDTHLAEIAQPNRFHIGITKRDTSGYKDKVPSYKWSENTTRSEVEYLNTESAITDDFAFTGEYIEVVGLCGYPPYNDRKACFRQNYFDDPLGKCEKRWAKILFGICTGLAATAIICVNIFIPMVVARCRDMRTHYDIIKVSLAIADTITGFLLFAAVIPNMAGIHDMSEEELIVFGRRDANSVRAIVVGSLVTASKQASLLHLCFLSIERFMAIKRPFRHINRRTRTIIMTLVGMWTCAIISAFSPALFPQHFEYRFQPALLIHMMTMKVQTDSIHQAGYVGLTYTAATIVLPYVITVSVCILTGIVSYKKLKSSARLFVIEHKSPQSNSEQAKALNEERTSPRNQSHKKRLKPEISVFITLLIMIAAFTLTLLPFGIVMALFVTGVLNCSNYTIPYVASFYFGSLNSLANGIIYSMRDPRFRSSVKSILRIKNRTTIQSKKFSHKDCRSSQCQRELNSMDIS